jgi:hypothetical protein
VIDEDIFTAEISERLFSDPDRVAQMAEKLLGAGSATSGPSPRSAVATRIDEVAPWGIPEILEVIVSN